jgi:hypothetical protein
MPQKRDEVINPDLEETKDEEREETEVDKTEDAHEKAKRRKRGKTHHER